LDGDVQASGPIWLWPRMSVKSINHGKSDDVSTSKESKKHPQNIKIISYGVNCRWILIGDSQLLIEIRIKFVIS